MVSNNFLMSPKIFILFFDSEIFSFFVSKNLNSNIEGIKIQQVDLKNHILTII